MSFRTVGWVLVLGVLFSPPAAAQNFELLNVRTGFSPTPPDPTCRPPREATGEPGIVCWTQLSFFLDGYLRGPESFLVGWDLQLGSRFTDDMYAIGMLTGDSTPFPWDEGRFHVIPHFGAHRAVGQGEVRVSGGLLLGGSSLSPDTRARLEAIEVAPDFYGSTRLGGVFRFAADGQFGIVRIGFRFDFRISNEVAFEWSEFVDLDSDLARSTTLRNSDAEILLLPRFAMSVPATELVSFAFEFGAGPAVSAWNEGDRTQWLQLNPWFPPPGPDLASAEPHGFLFLGAEFHLPGPKAGDAPALPPDRESGSGDGGGGDGGGGG